MKAYYNEFDPKAAAWLRQLIKNKDITDGEVDERSITEVEPSDLYGFDRCHFFAGIGTWDYCLNNAGWGDKPIWTASLPCQPFSAAGKGLGKSDERHLLPHFLELVRQCKPNTIIGEQVEAAIRHGWLDDLQANMEAEGYAIGHCVLGAHSVGAPHIRQRLYWLADSNSEPKRYELKKDFCDEMFSKIWVENSYNLKHDGININKIRCADNKLRPVKPGILPLVNGIAKGMVHSGDTSAPIDANNTQEARVMRLKGYGNAIQAQTAIAFIKAYMVTT